MRSHCPGQDSSPQRDKSALPDAVVEEAYHKRRFECRNAVERPGAAAANRVQNVSVTRVADASSVLAGRSARGRGGTNWLIRTGSGARERQDPVHRLISGDTLNGGLAFRSTTLEAETPFAPKLFSLAAVTHQKEKTETKRCDLSADQEANRSSTSGLTNFRSRATPFTSTATLDSGTPAPVAHGRQICRRAMSKPASKKNCGRFRP